MTRVALATCTELPHLDADESHLVRALQAKGLEHVIAPWDGADDPFVESDIAVIRSTWDYTQRVDEFVAWSARIELAMKAKGRELLNPASVVRWNTHKRYLTELAKEGVAIVPTVIVDKDSKGSKRIDLKLLLTEHAWTSGAVVKPCVSAGSRDTVRVHGLNVDEAQALLDRELPTRDMMVQPYVSGIEAGEVSLIFIDGALSHAVNKIPKDSEFRSQPEFGSDVKAVEASGEMRMRARDILRTVGGKLLYARVDFVKGNDGKPWLMELELVEPSLYLAWNDEAATKLAEAIAKRAPQQK